VAGAKQRRLEHVDALVLAGRRGGVDPVASAAGVSHKALAPINGRPLLSYVLAALREAPAVARITVSIEDAEPLRRHPEFGPAIARGELSLHRSGTSPADSVRDFVERTGSEAVLVTTADHPLLTGETVRAFIAEALAGASDLVVALVPDGALLAVAPHSKRTWLRLGGERFTGANLFLARSPGAAKVAAFWRKAEGVRKEPWRLAALFGAVTLARFMAGRLPLDAALAAISRATGARVGAVRLADGRAGIDVDKLDDLVLVEKLLRNDAPGPREA
jgi:molybdopterin-guanine dinucleotide biosynthesis protein A